MKKWLTILFVAFAYGACDDADSTPGEITRYFYEQSELSPPTENVGMYVMWGDGEKTAIQFSLIHPQEDAIADDELTEIFWIEVPSDKSQFTSTSDEVSNDSGIEVYYVRSCFCGFERFYVIEYEVSGQKLSATEWKISFDIRARSGEYEYTLKDAGNYVLRNK